MPVEDMRELGSTASLSYPVPADGQEMDAGTELGTQSIWPSIYPEILAARRGPPLDDRVREQPPARGATRVRLNELANEERRSRASRAHTTARSRASSG